MSSGLSQRKAGNSKLSDESSSSSSSAAASSSSSFSPSPSLSPSPDSLPPSKDKSKDQGLLVDSKTKWKNAFTRTYTTFLMLGGFALIIYLGHLPLLIFLLVVQVTMFREVKRLSSVLLKEKQITKKPSRWLNLVTKGLQWYWFWTAFFFAYGWVAITYFHVSVPYHMFLSFMFYAAGIVGFVTTLDKEHYRYQFQMFAWIHLTLLLVVIQSTFIIVNMYQGLIWFILPALLIVTNDVFAYFFGFFFGRTPLIQLSPKKTIEGFVGALVITLLNGFFLSRWLSGFDYMICPKTSDFFSFDTLSCDPPLAFIPVPNTVPPSIQSLLHFFSNGDWSTVMIAPVQWHGLFLALFASLIAPFGGFFASGFKRAFHIKDFGETIPGHGGVTDRMDCQIMMGLFVFVYYWNLVQDEINPNSIFVAFSLLNDETKLAVFNKLQATLTEQGLLKSAATILQQH